MLGPVARRRLLITAALVMAVSAMPMATSKGPDSAGYQATDETAFSFIDVAASGGASILVGSDDGTAALTLPFAFEFYGVSYTMVCVSSNGAAYFVTNEPECSTISDFANTDLTSTAPPGDRPGLFPFWTDLAFEDPGTGVAYQTLGDAGSRRFVLQWNNAHPVGSPNPVAFEAILFEGSNQVLFQYKTVDLGAGDPATKGGLATIGVRHTNGQNDDKQVAWSHNAPVLANESAILFTGSLSAPTMTATGGVFVYNGSPREGTGAAYGAGGLSLPVTLSYAGTGATSYGPSTQAPTNAGTYNVTASFGGNGSYSSASATDALTINKADATVTIVPYSGTYDGLPHGLSGTATGVGGVALNGLNLGDMFTNAPGGTAFWSFNGGDNYKSQSGSASVTIGKATATVTLSNMTQTFTGSPLSPTVTTTPAGLSIDLVGAPQVGPGSFPVTATITDGQNYSGSATGTFVINATTSLTTELISPNGLEQRFIGSPTTIRWNVAGATSIDVALSRDGGQSYTNIPGCTGLAGSATSCVWTPTGPTTIQARVRVTARNAANTTASDTSALSFRISSGSPSVKVQLPTGLTAWAVGTTKLIGWTHNLGANSTFRIELSRNNGGSWETLSASADGALLVLGGFPWKVTGPATANAKIRVTSLDSPASSVSSAFTIANPAVTVTAPNTNVSWTRNTQRTISWTHNLGLGTSMKIEVSRDGGTSWTTIAASVANGSTTGSYNWTVTGPVTTTARIRVSWTADASVTDASDVNFRIQ